MAPSNQREACDRVQRSRNRAAHLNMPPDPESNDAHDDPPGEGPSAYAQSGDFFSNSDLGIESKKPTEKQHDHEDTFGTDSDSLLGETITLSSGERNVLGNFRLVSKLGSGGFGAVYEAEDLRLDRKVAIKIAFRRSADVGTDYHRRVFHEGRAAAALDHPNIVSVYDVAELDGKPYIVTQLIQGVTLKDRISSGRMAFHQSASMIADVARAIDYAHSKGIVHRDLKPGNILLDVGGVPYVNDFGIAKHAESDDTISRDSAIIGTPAYMSPEQAAGRSGQVDRRSDLYSLGVILYELITGEKPFRGSSRMLIHHVMHTEPQPPRSLNQTIPRDLETICLKCLEKDPDRRYANCAELATELQRFIDGDPIKARPVSGFEHFIRRCRRYPLTTSITVAFICAIVAGLAGVTWQWRRAERNRRQEENARIAAQESRKQLADQIAFSRQMLHDAESKLAFGAMRDGNHRQVKQRLKELSRFGDLEFRLLRTMESRYREAFRHIEWVTDVSISDDERYLAATGLRTLLVWDTESKQIVFRSRERGKQLRFVRFLPESNLLAWGGELGVVNLKPIGESGAKLHKWDHGKPINALSVSRDGAHVLIAGDDGDMTLWSVADNAQIDTFSLQTRAIHAVDFIDETAIVVGDDEGHVSRYDLASRATKTLVRHFTSINSVDVSDDGKRFVAGSANNRFSIGEIDDPDSIAIEYYGGGPIRDVEFWEERDALVIAALYGRFAFWSLSNWGAVESHRYFQGDGHFAIARRSNRVFVGSGDGTILQVELDAISPNMLHVPGGAVQQIHSSDHAIIVCHDVGPASLIDPRTGRMIRRIPADGDTAAGDRALPRTLTCVDATSDGEHFAFGTNDGRVLIWESKTGKIRMHGVANQKTIRAIQLLNDSTTALTGGANGGVLKWDLSRESSRQEIAVQGGVVRGLAVSTDAKHAVSVSANGVAVTFEIESGETINRLDVGRSLQSVAWSRDSNRIAIGEGRGTVMIYPQDLSGEPVRIDVQSDPVIGVQFSRSGRRLVTLGRNRITFSNLETMRTGAVLDQIHSTNIRDFSISDDETSIVSGDNSGVVRKWRLSPPANSTP